MRLDHTAILRCTTKEKQGGTGRSTEPMPSYGGPFPLAIRSVPSKARRIVENGFDIEATDSNRDTQIVLDRLAFGIVPEASE